jgi:hypothetical protein
VHVNAGELEVIWPLHRSHYLNVPEAGMVNMDVVDAPPAPSVVATPGRPFAAAGQRSARRESADDRPQ